MTNDERAIRELVQTWMTATKAGDIQTVLSLMTDDVVFMTPRITSYNVCYTKLLRVPESAPLPVKYLYH